MSRRKYHQWPSIKEEVEDILEKLKVVNCGITLVVDSKEKEERKYSIAGEDKEQILESFAKREKLDRSTIDVGRELLDDS